MEQNKVIGLTPDQLKWKCDLSKLDFQTTDELEILEDIIVQDRALKSLKLGTDIRGRGYNIFISGLSGTGRLTTIKNILEKIAHKKHEQNDFCYVNNFKNTREPILLVFSKGKGKRFKKDMQSLVEYVIKNLSQIFESDQYLTRRNDILESFNSKEKNLFKGFEEKISQDNFALVQVSAGQMQLPDIYYLVEGEPKSIDYVKDKVEKGELELDVNTEQLEEKLNSYRVELSSLLRKSRTIYNEMNTEMENLDREMVSSLIDEIIAELKEKYKEEKVHRYLNDVKEHTLSNLNLFREKTSSDSSPMDEQMKGLQGMFQEKRDIYKEFDVNVVLDSSDRPDCPVIVETNPKFNNLFGTIERTFDRMGIGYSNFLDIKAGTLLQAHGGYLVMNAIDVLMEPGVWNYLNRVLKYKKLQIQGFESILQFSTTTLKPEPIDIDTKVILIGDTYLYSLLYRFDEGFRKTFKIKASFDSELHINDKRISEYARFITKIVKEEDLKPFTKEAVARVIEHGVKLAGSQDKVTARFSDIADIIRESHYWCELEHQDKVSSQHVEKALDEMRYRNNLSEEKVHEFIEKEKILIDTTGKRIGQINGLAIFDLGFYAFGRPTRITASTGIGEVGITNIEREAKMSGNIHDKGVLIITGFLLDRFGHQHPLTLHASVCFEQSYSGVDGDSASTTELYAILSSLSGVPIRQDLAVTGSFNQKGDIQPIGGVNEKIEGFFEVCESLGLTGSQGVLIPKQNVQDLQLDRKVIEAVEAGKFHIYPVERVEQGIELLMEIPAGQKDDQGNYPEESVFGKVACNLYDIYQTVLKKTKPKKADE